MPFSHLGLSPYLLPALQRALQEQGYVQPTPVQQRAVPVIVQGRDVIAMAPTGSGKTAAFVVPLLQQFITRESGAARAVPQLVLVPTRELALQVAETFTALAAHLPRRPKVVVAVGGVSINPQMMELRGGADVLVATPGRLLDLLSHNALSLKQLATLVLDEADRLLDLGFGEELAQILLKVPAKRQTLLFSATFPPAIARLAAAGLRDPQRIEIDSHAEQPEITQRAIRVDSGRRTQLLAHLLRQQGWPRALVFVGSRHGSEVVADKLAKAGVSAAALHGDLSNGRRLRVLQSFRTGEVQVLVATDVAARGIDIVQLPVVVNYDLPRSPADYTHRIGRTGRAGESGLAVSFVSADTEAHLRLIEKRQQLQIEREQVPGFEPQDVAAPAAVADGNGGIKGRRPSKKDRLRAAAAAGTPPAK
ncbi:DEAD/DEAH box helicase [Stenotrophomonas sp. YIM B06876]|uniref:DEAD/DEAH box helicase n=1 Tax=Stenotrophomonas sp. YIM B06876 TaxID=3060211 RepID=UPI00273831EF|nr:DEAD/DEAH box helicase [Stenotrophomonas sp. YIM B06876]